MPETGSYTPAAPALTRGLAILKAVARSHDGLSFNEILAVVDAPRATASRLLRVLRDQQDLEKSARDGRYRLGPAMGELTDQNNLNRRLVSVGRPLLKGLRDRTGHTCLLIRFAVRDNQPETECLAKAVHPDSFAMQHEGNRSRDMSHGPWCWLWYARAEAGDRQAMHKRMGDAEDFIARWPEHEAFMDRHGFAFDDDLPGVGIRRLGAPILGSDGKLIAAVGLGALRQALPKADVVGTGRLMIALADEIASRMGWGVRGA